MSEDCNATTKCLSTTDCMNPKDKYIECPKYSYWDKKLVSNNADGNNFQKNCKLDGFNGKSCNFWGDKKPLSDGDKKYIISQSGDSKQCKQLQYYALQGKWDEINARLDASKHCPKNKDAYVNQIRYLLCQLQNCRTRYYEDMKTSFSKNPFRWNSSDLKKNFIFIIAGLITLYFLIIGSISALFQMDGFGQGMAVFDMFDKLNYDEWYKKLGFVGAVLVLIILITRFFMSITFWITRKKMSTIDVHSVNANHELNKETDEKKTMKNYNKPYSDTGTDGEGWWMTLWFTIAMCVVLLGIYVSYKMNDKKPFMKYMPRILLIISICLFLGFYYIKGMPSSIYSPNESNKNENKDTSNIQFDQKCDTANQASIDTDQDWGGSFGELMLFVMFLIIFTVIGKVLYVNTDRNDPGFFKLLWLFATMPFTIILVPLVILLNWSCAGIYITAYPVLMILQRMITGIVRYVGHKHGLPGFEKYDSDELNTYLNKRNLGWPLLLIPLVQGATFHAYKMSTGNNTKSRRARSSNFDLTSNNKMFGTSPFFSIWEGIKHIKDNL